jgi:hypothetical protein
VSFLATVISLVSFWIGLRTRRQSQLDKFIDLQSELLVKITETRHQVDYIKKRVAGVKTEMTHQLEHLPPQFTDDPEVQLWFKELNDVEALARISHTGYMT